jgi:hypothetical protein
MDAENFVIIKISKIDSLKTAVISGEISKVISDLSFIVQT